MNSDDFKKLAEHILSGNASEEELARYNHWFNSLQNKEEYEIENEPQKERDLLHRIRADIRLSDKHTGFLKLKHVAAAAILLIAIGAGSYIFYRKNDLKDRAAFVTSKGIPPGKDQAVLTLADGKHIVLAQTNNGQIAQQSGSLVIKSDSNWLVYHAAMNAQNKLAVQYNLLSTPRGGQYKVVLPDGTKAWLNSVSSIQFPTSFEGNERDVQISGEVYFEVAHNKLKPFIVSAKDVKISVLGTHFDVNAYGDDGHIKATLLQGSVKVANNKQNVVITPGEQALVSETENDISVNQVNVANIVAWTQGLLSFEDNNVKEFMANLSRWYDLDIEYKGKISVANMGGMINRNTNLSDVLSALDAEGIHAKLEGRKLIVSN